MAKRNITENRGKLLFTYMVDNTMCNNFWDINRHGNAWVSPQTYKKIMELLYGE